MTHQKIKSILGVDVRARHNDNKAIICPTDPFENPLIHKKINGNEIVPLDIHKLWGR